MRAFAVSGAGAFALRVVSSIALAVLAGCIDGAGIKPEASYIDPTGLDAGSAVRTAVSDANWPTSDWWLGWRDPQLDMLMQQAEKGSPTLAIVRSRVTAAIWQARAAHADELPDIEGAAHFARTRFPRYATPSPPGGTTVWNNAAAVALSWDLDFWGKNRAIEQGALNHVQASVADAQFAKVELEAAVARTYTRFALQAALLAVYRSINEEQLRNMDIAVKRRAAGISGEIDASQAKAQYEAGRTDIARTLNEIALIRLQIAYLVGEGPGFGDQLKAPLLPDSVATALPSALPAELVGHRADVVAQRWRAAEAAKKIDAAHADFYPNIDLVASASLASLAPFGGFFNFINSDAVGHSVGIAGSLPIFDAGRRRANFGVANAEYDDAVLKYNDTVLSAVQSVAEDVTSLQSLDVQQQSAESAWQSSRRAYDLAVSGYRGGITEYLDVLVAQKIMLEQERDLTLIHAQRVDAWVLLMKDLGGGAQINAIPVGAKEGESDARGN
ncbi:efflux transporter outer membrane subunit [Paraburkholderia sp. CNPSo 3274]|uniref:efflux transporter outer membrane subunit n=1 Tax=Paraburkholderia sp. CNPSo 3274 TaxID=2940932 RepID=UPI0020B8205F|nr:efflux transporter outer membrane subunit [Paraburkholderia sp. CNPSo 3274]MCP3709269.1 efflux transporter outer membrane subunit [Paraburkholderia sp. CNPSo 3274]